LSNDLILDGAFEFKFRIDMTYMSITE
jgi:hypothetical protein